MRSQEPGSAENDEGFSFEDVELDLIKDGAAVVDFGDAQNLDGGLGGGGEVGGGFVAQDD